MCVEQSYERRSLALIIVGFLAGSICLNLLLFVCNARLTHSEGCMVARYQALDSKDLYLNLVYASYHLWQWPSYLASVLVRMTRLCNNNKCLLKSRIHTYFPLMLYGHWMLAASIVLQLGLTTWNLSIHGKGTKISTGFIWHQLNLTMHWPERLRWSYPTRKRNRATIQSCL